MSQYDELFKKALEENREAWEKSYESIPLFETQICPIRFKVPDYTKDGPYTFYPMPGYG